MAATTGAFHEAQRYAAGQSLPIIFVIEDNTLSCDTPTQDCWGDGSVELLHYRYERTYPHVGTGKCVQF